MERLKTLCRTDDGFEIAQMDLQLRGPGDFFGRRQHGLPALHIADMGRDLEVLREVGEAAAQLLAEDPALEGPALRALRGRAEALFERSEISLN